ncbi:SRPBCC family protein [Sphingomonas sp.]|uniref:SRPBCC family protein n=1 Tax=Sphingomonas sp. TaxID=28214 RepID=UPI001B0C93EB|nr:SRPBCC family protein [Sphingomonas sp.]MBO9714041.1 SRPBCC family protein [Sphingomonas sp.]
MTIAPVVRSVEVKVPPARAFELFAGHMSRWWHEGHHIAPTPFQDIVVEPREGGRWFERDAEGNECEWGKVLEWDPPRRLVLGWQLGADFKYDPDFLNEVELAFTPAGSGTLVTLTHHNLQRFGDAADKLAPSLGEGWAMLLGLYRDFSTEETAA